MEQIIFLVIIYVLYALFTSFVKKMKQQQQQRPGAAPGPPASRTPTRPVPDPAAETPELDIPPFLREMLGLEKPKQAPAPPEPPVIEEETVETEIGQTEHSPPSIPEYIPASAGMEADEIEDLSKPFPTVKTKEKSDIQKLLGGRNNLRNAFILKEILDTPISKRERHFPFFGHR